MCEKGLSVFCNNFLTVFFKTKSSSFVSNFTNMKTHWLKLFFSLFIFYTQQLSAQPPSKELENLTLTATLTETKQKETGRNLFIIRGELFQQLPVSSIDELLRYLPGVEIQQRGPQGSQSDIVIRGGTFQQVLVILDGLRLNDPLTGHFNSYIPIHPGEIDRIEILKGAASALYGSDAVGGVIHIITKTFSSRIHTNNVSAGLEAGEKGLISGNGHIQYVKNKTVLSGGVLSNHATGQPLRGTTGFFDNTSTSIAWQQLLKTNWQLNFRTAADFRSFNAQNFYTTFLSDTAREKVKSYWQHLGLYKIKETYTLKMDAAYKILQDEFWFRPASVPNNNKTTLVNGQIIYTRKWNLQHSLAAGLQTLRKNIISNDRGNHSLWHTAAFVMGKHRLSDKLFVNESLRADWDENYGWKLLPQINLTYDVSKLSFRASAGKGIRDADFTERYNNYNKALVTGGSIGNPELEAEKSFNTEAGADYHFSDVFRASTTFFYRKQNNLIDWTPTPYADMPRKNNLIPTGNYALAKNIAQVETRGVELDLVFKKQFEKNISLFASAGMVFLRSTGSDANPSFYISSHARQLINITTLLSVQDFVLSFTGLYKKRKEQKATNIQAEITPSYYVMNARLAYTVYKKIQLYVEADNLFNKSYSDLLGSKMPGRWISGGFQITLPGK